jgi:hypothetical protein
MAQQVTVEAQRAALARRLRPLYPGLLSDEFERMVARIAEIELYSAGPHQVDTRDRYGPRPVRYGARHG